jgi:hypothetical protein
MIDNLSLLRTAGIFFERFGSFASVVCSQGNQLFGPYTALQTFRQTYRDKSGRRPYDGWEVHHIVEDQDLQRLGIAQHFPVYKQQLCVILPQSAHVNRINNILRNRNPSRYAATAPELLGAYREAYELVGDYTGGGERKIRQELLGIVQAAFRLANAR